MHYKSTLTSFFVFACLITAIFTTQAQQQNVSPNPVLQNTNQERLRELAAQWEQEAKESLERARHFARKNGLPLRQKLEDGTIIEIQGIGQDSLPYYYTTDNKDAAQTISTDQLYPGGGANLELTGAGMTLGIWDSDGVLLNHQEFSGRATQQDNASSTSDHATHVAGTMVGAGIKTQAQGMAYQASLDAYDWSMDNAEMASAAKNGLLASNHAYSQITGFHKNTDSNYWEWYGDPDISPVEDYKFGFYNFDAENWDEIAQNAPYYLIVKSAGNDRDEDGPSSGEPHYIRNEQGEWEESTINRDPDGNYDCLPPKSTAKNVLTVGAVEDIAGGYQDPSDVTMTGFSAWGPTDDGRIKPDLVANGHRLYSATDEDDTSYAIKSGTSTSAPSVTGSLGLLQQHYQDTQSAAPLRAATLKALVIHTADEAGTAPGPDYEYGWGLMNTEKAAQVISSMGNTSMIRENSLQNNGASTFHVEANGNEPLKATICWNDEPGTPPAPALDPTDKMLVNDLDLRILDTGNNATQPWVMTPSNPSAPASKGDNTTDNVEQVVIENPKPGETYTIRINHKDQLYQNETQNFSLIVTGMTSEIAQTYCQNTQVIQANQGIVEDGSQTEMYGNNSDCSWHIQSPDGHPLTLNFLEFSTEQGGDLLHVYGGSSTNGELLGTYSGNEVPETLETSYEEVFLHFITNDQGRDKGWKIRYTGYDPNACSEPFFMDYPSEDPAESSYIFQMNTGFDQNNVESGYQVKEVGTAFTDWISSNEGTFSPDFPLKVDSVVVHVTHENNSGLEDTFQLYMQGLSSNDYPAGPVIWEENIVTDESLSPSGDWQTGQIASLTFHPEMVIGEPFFLGLKYKGPMEDTASILTYHQSVGTGQDPQATEAEYGIAYRKHPAYSNDWLPEPDGTEQVFHDNNNNGTYDRGTNEAHLMQVLAIVPIVTEPYNLDTPEIIADTSQDDTVTLSAHKNYPGYQWYKDGTAIQGEDAQSMQLEESGNYQVAGFDQNGCNAVSKAFTYDHNTAIPEESHGPRVDIYPNPGSGQFHWEMPEMPGQTVQVRVQDLAGRTVHQATISRGKGRAASKGTLDLMHLSKGSYLVEFSHKKGKHVEKVVIQ